MCFSLDQKQYVAAVTIDLRKAFHSISHRLLIAKLRAYGLGENSVKLIKSYLDHRLQRVMLGGHFSDWRSVKSGVPQGGLLGTLFFNIFINDIILFCDNSSLRLYADDTTLYSSDPSLNILEIKINLDLASITDWLSINYLSINTSKTKAITFSNSDFTTSFRIKNKIIEQKECLDLLGVTIDSSLTLNVHIKNTLNKVYVKLSAIRRIKNLISILTATKLYKALILPHFEYCSPLLFGVTKGLRDKLEKANCFGLRPVLKLPSRLFLRRCLTLGQVTIS